MAPTIFGAPDATSVLIRYTRYGDATLDGTVNTLDFNALAMNFNEASAVWTQGDFNYDGVVNALDFNALATNFGLTLPSAGPELGTIVPEPSLFGLLVAPMLRAQRRRFAGGCA